MGLWRRAAGAGAHVEASSVGGAEAGVLDAPRASAPAMEKTGAPVFGARNLGLAATLFVAALVTLITLQARLGIPPLGVSSAPHYLYQAESFLRGRWDLTPPAPLHDTIQVGGKTYMVYPPFPALLMLPFVALFGAQTSDIFITTVISALNLPLLYLLLEQARVNGLTARSQRDNLIISLLLYFGSINLYLSLGGEVWFTAQIICLTCGLGSLLLALRRHYGWSAALLACAFFTRGTMALGFPLVIYLAWQDAGVEPALERFACSLWRRRPDWRAVPWRRLAPPGAVICGALALFLLRNALVFGSPFESGYGIQNQQDYPQITHGVYSLAYVSRNLLVEFFTFPHITFAGPFAITPQIDLIGVGIGMSVFATTPLFLLLFAHPGRFNGLRLALQITVALIVSETLLYATTGWYQFGSRYLFDAYPFAFLLLAMTRRRIDWLFIALGLFGLMINVAGAGQFWM
jgi:hypothetical protein